MPTVSTPFTYCHLLNLLSAFTLTVVSFPFVLWNFSFVFAFTKVNDVDLMMLSATLLTIISVLSDVCANDAAEQNSNAKQNSCFMCSNFGWREIYCSFPPLAFNCAT